MLQHSWACRCCGAQQADLPLDFFSSAPASWASVPEDQRGAAGNKLDEDLRMIGSKDFFVRGCVEIPIIGQDEIFVWGLWVSISESNFRRVLDLWSAEVENEPSIDGYLGNNVTSYPAALGLVAQLQLRSGNQRPKILLKPTNHPLALDQRNGISLTRVEELVSLLLPHH